jgi:transcriptional regulator with PAS, ATPase and Fis domain
VNVRIIAATNRDLSKEVKQKTFREDLFYRLNVIVLKAIPLRERIEDIALLSRYFLDRFQSPASPVKTIGREAQEVLINYNWPGNVRELENCIRRAIAIGLHKTIRPSDLPETIKDSFEIQVSKDFSLSSLEKTAIKNALIISKGNRIKAADMLDIGIATLYRKLKKYNLN